MQVFVYYKFTSFSVTGFVLFIPLKTTNPTIDKTGNMKEIVDEKIETVCYKKDLKKSFNN